MSSPRRRGGEKLVASCGPSTSSFIRSLIFYFGILCSVASGSPLLCLDHFSCELSDQQKNVACSDGGIDIVPLCLNPSLISLSLHNTRIHTLYLASLRYYVDLKYLNLSHNQINEIEPKTFEYQENLEELHLADNKISHLAPDIFLGLQKLTVLALQSNLIEELTDDLFLHMPKLQYLDLSHNRINHVSDEAFKGLGHLTVLSLARNFLGEVPSKALSKVPRVAELSIGGNAFNYIQKSELRRLHALTLLDLSGSNFTMGLVSDMFDHVRGIRKLRLNDCQLPHVPTKSLSLLTALETLELSRNMFVEIPPEAFLLNQKLMSLVITGCPLLERVSTGALRDNLNLARVDLSRNSKLTYLPHDDFRYLNRLSYLDLHGNNFQYIPHDVVPWNDVQTFYLHDNPLTCNCSSSWLRKMLIAGNRTDLRDVVCANPPELFGRSLSNTHIQDLLCGLDPTVQGLVIALSVCGLLIIIGGAAFLFFYRSRNSCVQKILKRPKWRQSRRGSNPRSYDSHYPCLKDVPRTEL